MGPGNEATAAGCAVVVVGALENPAQGLLCACMCIFANETLKHAHADLDTHHTQTPVHMSLFLPELTGNRAKPDQGRGEAVMDWSSCVSSHDGERWRMRGSALGTLKHRGVARIWRLRRHGVLCAREARGENFLS